VAEVKAPAVSRSPLRLIDAARVSKGARAETRNREVFLPPITVYRWWARRTLAVYGAILDAFSTDRPGELLVVDPFAGGGVIPLAAATRGHRVYAQDVNPWATAGLAGMLGLGSATDLSAAGEGLAKLAKPMLDDAYGTRLSDGEPASISYTMRVATAKCPVCGEHLRLFPHALLSLYLRRERHNPAAFLACPAGHVFSGTESGTQRCPTCRRATDPAASYSVARRTRCYRCGREHTLADLVAGAGWRWEPVLVQRVSGRRRELGEPTGDEMAQASDARWPPECNLGSIPTGQETAVLLRHGFHAWDDIYPARQRHITRRLLDLASMVEASPPAVSALRLAILGTAEMAGYLSRWDRYYLKSYESMAGHRFNLTTFAVEPNVWGNGPAGRGSVMRRLLSFTRAARWLTDHGAGDLAIQGPLVLAQRRISAMPVRSRVRVVEGSSERILLPSKVADLCLTDPPFHDDVQYDELSLPLRAWSDQSLNRLLGEAVVNGFAGHNTNGREYGRLLTRIFQEIHRTLRADGHLIFGYANREPRAWSAVLGALRAAGFQAAGYVAVHSENETDVVKRDVRACMLDLLMDVVPIEADNVEPCGHHEMPDTDEGGFLGLVAEAFARVHTLTEDDLTNLEDSLASTPFLAARSARES
jgi:putative DNA methylase